MGDSNGARPPRLWTRTLLHACLWLLLGGWIGGFGLFALVIARTAFEVLPSTEVAGRLVGPVLTALNLYGAAAGMGVAAIAFAMGRSRLLQLLPLALAMACLYTQFGVTAEINEIQPFISGPEGTVEAAARWNQLHQRSMGIFSVVWLGTFTLLGLNAHEDAKAAQAT
jgi:hypothetical protein